MLHPGPGCHWPKRGRLWSRLDYLSKGPTITSKRALEYPHLSTCCYIMCISITRHGLASHKPTCYNICRQIDRARVVTLGWAEEAYKIIYPLHSWQTVIASPYTFFNKTKKRLSRKSRSFWRWLDSIISFHYTSNVIGSKFNQNLLQLLVLCLAYQACLPSNCGPFVIDFQWR